MRSWFILVVLLACVAMITGCDSGSDESGGDYAAFTFVNNTDNDEIFVARDGGPEWDGGETFRLDNKGDERRVTLKDSVPGQIKYRWTSTGGNTRITESGSDIIFSD